jgi:hypothetical protein
MATLPGKKTKEAPVETAPVAAPVAAPVETAPVETAPVEAAPVEAPSVEVDPNAPRHVSAEEVRARSGGADQPPSVVEDDNAPKQVSKEEVDARIQLQLDPWDREDKYKPGVWSRGWQHLTGMDRPPDEYNLERISASTLASITGGYLGARVPVAPGPAGFLINPVTGSLMFSAAGAAAGTYAPETTLEILEYFGVKPEGYRDKHGFSPSRLRYEAENEAFLDGVLGGAISAAKLAWRTASGFVTGVDKAGKETAKKAKELYDIDLMPVQVGRRQIAKGFVNVMGRFPWIGTRIRTLGGEAEQKIKQAYGTLGDKAFKKRTGGVTASNKISRFIFEDAKLLVDDFGKEFKKYYDEIWKRADELGVLVRPTRVKEKAAEIIVLLDKKATSKVGGKISDGPILKEVREFIAEEVDKLTDTQSLRQMDGFISQIDQKLAKLEKHQVHFADTHMLGLRQAALKDVTENAIGEKALEITARLRRIDEEYSYTLHSLFETSTAKNIETVTKGGLRRTTKLSDTNTKQHVDQLAKVMINIDSPESIQHLYRLVSKDTFRKIVSTTLDDAVQKAKRVNPDGTEEFSSAVFAKYLGLDPTRVSARTESVSEMLRLSGSSFKMGDLTTLIKTTETIAGLPLPNASVFLQRKAVLGSFKGVLSGALPGLAATAGSGVLAGIWGIALMLGGGKLATRLITDPNTLKPLREVIKTNKYSIANWKLFPQILRLSLSASLGEGSITQDQFNELSKMVDPMVEGFKREIEEQEFYPLSPILKSDKMKKKIAARKEREAVLNE